MPTRLLFPVALAFLVTLSVTFAAPPPSPAPQLYALSAPTLAANRDRLARGDAALAPALKQLLADADALLPEPSFSVLDKTLVAPTGDKHDYMSMGPYWWPDPSKPDGLPYIKRDGQVNPASKQGTDSNAFALTCNRTQTLALAWYFSGNRAYAEKAARNVRVWFLDPATAMHPNLQYAQAVPGLSAGRGIGLIEARHLASMCDGIALLAGSGAWTDADAAALHAWLESYYHWLTTSKNGHDEDNAPNNHGTWYDVQATHLALVLGHADDARARLQTALKKRFDAHIAADGSLPEELARTNSLGYSFFDLEGLTALAVLGDQVGVDAWHHTTPKGASLHSAIAYLAPWVEPGRAWRQKDIKPADRSRLLPIFATYLEHAADPDFRHLLKRFDDATTVSQRWHLFH